MADHMLFKNRQRAAFILSRLACGRVVRQDLESEFNVSRPSASTFFGRFIAEHPGAMRYDMSAKAYVPGPEFQRYWLAYAGAKA
jgi:hypothetical protein